MKIECPRCGEQVEYRPGAVQVCSYCRVSLQLPDVNQLPEHLRSQWFKEQAAAKAKEEKRRQKMEAEERRKQKERQTVRERTLAATRAEMQSLDVTGPAILIHKSRKTSRKSFVDRLIYALDPRFERYITPQIIRVFWALSLILALLAVMIYALGSLQTALPRTISVPNTRPREVVYRESVIADLIEIKEFEQMMAESRREEPPEPREPSPPVSADDKPKIPKPDPKDIRNEYEKLSLEQLRANLAKLEQEHPTHRTEWVYQQTLLYPLWVSAAVVTVVLNLLIIRMVCEFVCVVFNIAAHLSEIRRSLSMADPD